MPEKISIDNLTFDFFSDYFDQLHQDGHKGIVVRGRGYETEVRRFFEDIKPKLFRRLRMIPCVLVHPFPNRSEFFTSRGQAYPYPDQLENYEIEHPFARFIIYDPINKFGNLGERYYEFHLVPEKENPYGDLYEHFRAHHF